MPASASRSYRPWPVTMSLVLLLTAACGPRIPADAVAVYDGGDITAPEARRYLRSLDRRRLRTDAALDDEQGIASVLCDLAALEILAAEAPSEPSTQVALYLDPRASMLVQYYVERTGKRSHEVSEDEARAFYQEHLADRFTVPEAIKLQHIFLRADRHTKEEIERTVRTILDRLGTGTPFAQLVTVYSESDSANRGGVVGPVYRGRLEPTFEERVYHLAPGSPAVVRVPTGVHVVEVLERRPAEVTPFDEAKQQIVRAIMDHRDEAERDELLTSLRAKYGVLDRSDEPSLGPDDVALRIGEREMTSRELTGYLAARTMNRGSGVGAEQEVRRRLTDELITSNLLYLDAVDRGLDQEEEFIDRWQLRDLRRRAQLGEQQRLAAWAETVSDDEVLRYFQDNQGRFALPQRFQASYLQLPLGGGPPFALQQTLEELAAAAADADADPADIDRRCAEAGAVHVDMGWTTPVAAGRVGPEFQRRLLAITGPGSSGVFKDEGWLFVILVRAVEDRRPLVLPGDRDLVRARYVELRQQEILAEITGQLLADHHFRVLSTALFETADATS